MKSIIIPIFNQHDYTDECLFAVFDNTKDYEIILIDNGSTPPYKPPFSGVNEVRVIQNETNLGFPAAVNQGIRAARGDVIVLLNNDVIVTPAWADRLIPWLDEFGIVGPVTNYTAGLQRVTIGIYQSKEGLYQEAEAWGHDWDGVVEEVSFIIGFCMVFKKSLVDEIGLFDDTLWPCSGEEIDYCFKAREAGHKIGIVRDCYVHHEGSQTFNDLEKAGVLNYVETCKRNDEHLAKRWGPEFWLHQAIQQEEG